jgi:hypothetical protein
MKQNSLTGAAEKGRIAELSIVVLTRSRACSSGVIPEGSRGTVVHAYGDGMGYEVEFDEPTHCVVTVERDGIR